MSRDYIELECESCGDIFGYMFPVKNVLIVYSETLRTTYFMPDTEDD